MKRSFAKTISVCVILATASTAFAHAFLDHASPKVGSTPSDPPADVRITFTEKIEEAFSAIEVYDSDGKQIDKKDSHLDPNDATTLIVSLPAISPGVYKVVWHVVSTDTHKTNGDFKFTYQPKK